MSSKVGLQNSLDPHHVRSFRRISFGPGLNLRDSNERRCGSEQGGCSERNGHP